MSIVVSVYLKASDIPQPGDWQAAIRDSGFDVQLNTEFDPLTFSGFLPAMYRGEDTGFEFFLDEVDFEASDEQVRELLQGKDMVISLVTHSDLRELMVSVIAAGVLAKLTNGILHDEEADEYYSSENSVSWSKKLEQEILPDLEET